MNLHDRPPMVEDPLESLLAFHRCIERRLADLARLQRRLESSDFDAGASALAACVLQSFGAPVALHHGIEERELLPLLGCRLGPHERENFELLRGRLGGDHREIADIWRGLACSLEIVAKGLRRPLPAHAVGRFRVLWAKHIAVEECSLHLLALRHLNERDRSVLAHRMRARSAEAIGTA